MGHIVLVCITTVTVKVERESLAVVSFLVPRDLY